LFFDEITAFQGSCVTRGPFLVLSELIIAGAFSLTAWYGWQLRAVDWPAEIGDLSKV
jgi:hypothetical protein